MSSVDDENSSTSTSSSSVTMVRPMLRASMLRPSAFSSQLFATEKSDPDTPAARAPVGLGSACNDAENSTTKEQKVAVPDEQETEKMESPAGDDKSKPAAADPMALLTKNNGLAKSNPFTAVQVTPLASSSGFVFGQNVRDRVTGNVEEEGANGGPGMGAGNGMNGDLTFSAAGSGTSGGEEELNNGAVGGGPAAEGPANKDEASSRTLSEVAREYEEAKSARKRKFEEVETFTGEEDEINVLDVTCKLYTFAQVYEERGRGSLRLNDPKRGSACAVGNSRLVFRTAGSLRVLLNTKIWDGMIAEPASAKSLRLTAIDTTGQVKVYLVMARPSDIQSLAMALKSRIVAEKARVEKGAMETETEKKDTNGDWDEEEDNDDETKKGESQVTPDLIADTEKVSVSELEGDESDVEGLIVEVPVPKRLALDAEAKTAQDDDKPLPAAADEAPTTNTDTSTKAAAAADPPQETETIAD